MILLMGLLCFNFHCMGPDSGSVNYTNDSNLEVACFPSYVSMERGWYIQTYPDTAIYMPQEKLFYLKPHIGHTIYSDKRVDYLMRDCNVDTVSIYYFDRDTINRYGWETVQREYKVLQRYDLSIADIQHLTIRNGCAKIPYPPTAAMSEMRMYPPYAAQ